MIQITRKIAALAAGTMIITGAFAQTAIESPASTSLTTLQSGSPRQPIVEHFEDAQQQAQDLLTGARRHERAPADRIQRLSFEHEVSRIDPQEQARRLILGARNGGKVAKVTFTRDKLAANSPASSDPQKLAQRMILGAEVPRTAAQPRSASTTIAADSPR